MFTLLNANLHELMVRGVVFDEVDAVPEAVERLQDGWILVCLIRESLCIFTHQDSELPDMLAPGDAAHFVQVIQCPFGSENGHGTAQRAITPEEIVIDKILALIEDLGIHQRYDKVTCA